MHREEQLRADLAYMGDQMAVNYWANAPAYSTSAHLLLMQELAKGVKAKAIAEVGVGRSTVALRWIAQYIKASFHCCDRYDYRWLHPDLFVGSTKDFWKPFSSTCFQFIFLDHLSSADYSIKDADREIEMAWEHLDKPGILCVHDMGVPKYMVSMTKWAAKATILPYGNSLGIIVKGKWTKENDHWLKSADTTGVVK
jgi:hypothetical protein